MIFLSPLVLAQDNKIAALPGTACYSLSNLSVWCSIPTSSLEFSWKNPFRAHHKQIKLKIIPTQTSKEQALLTFQSSLDLGKVTLRSAECDVRAGKLVNCELHPGRTLTDVMEEWMAIYYATLSKCDDEEIHP